MICTSTLRAVLLVNPLRLSHWLFKGNLEGLPWLSVCTPQGEQQQPCSEEQLLKTSVC